MKDIIEDYVQNTMSAWNKETQALVNNFSKALRRDRETKIHERLIELGWTPPNLTGTAGKCNCWSVPSGLDCPVHGEMLKECANWMSTIRHDIERRALGGKPTPDLPLHARVAKALGAKIEPPQTAAGIWHMKFAPPHRIVVQPIPDYPNDLVAAMGAFCTYLINNCKIGQIKIYERGSGEITIYSGDLINTMDKFVYRFKAPLDANDFCEAIVAHSEGK